MTPFKINQEAEGLRLDVWLAQRFSDYSRAFLQKWIKAGHVTIKGSVVAPRQRLRLGDHVEVAHFSQQEMNPKVAPASPIAPSVAPGRGSAPQPSILFEDAALLVLNKPAGLVVHPAPSYRGTTLVDWLREHLGGRVVKLFTDPERLGLVHRLDKDTSGVLVIAKSIPAQVSLARQFRERTVHKTYWAWVHGTLASTSGRITAPVGRSRKDPKRMAVTGSGRASETEFEVKEALKEVSLLIVRPKTGRTHQIRVHTAALGHPIVGDVTYGASAEWAKEHGVTRPLLHAAQLELMHPTTRATMRFEAKPPADFRAARNVFRKLAIAAGIILSVLAFGTRAYADNQATAPAATSSAGSSASATKTHHKSSSSSSGVSSATIRQLRKEIGSLTDKVSQLQSEVSSMKDELGGIEAGLTQLDAARRLRDLERALPDMNAKITAASNNAEEARSQATDTTRKMKDVQDATEQFRDRLDRLQQQLIQQRAKQEDAAVAPPDAGSAQQKNP